MKKGEEQKKVSKDAAAGSTGTNRKARAIPSAGQKVLLVLFGFLLIALMEVGLRVVGYGKPSEREDPFVGFEKVYPLFSARELAGGKRFYVTNPNKLAFFNEQAFPTEKSTETFRIFCLGGSTTFGRPYEAPTAFPKWLEIGLNGMDASRRFEVINAGGISYASYRIVNLIEELMHYEPDLFVVYTGHNEFLETRTYEDILQADRAVTKVRTVLDRLRTYALVRQAVLGLKAWGKQRRTRFRMKSEVDAALDHVGGVELYRRDEDQKQAILRHFRFNLERMVDIARENSVELLFVTPVSSIRDFSPFKSEHAQGLSLEERRTWEKRYGQGISLYRAGDYAAALEAFRFALEIDPEYAELHYEVAKCYEGLGQHEKARVHYVQARDLDVCPLRAIGQIEAIVRDVVREREVALVDLVPVFEARSDHGLLGKEWFLDHVHPTVEGHQVIADEIVSQLVNRGVVAPGAGWNAAKRAALYKEVFDSLDGGYFSLKNLNLGKVLAWAEKYREALDPLEAATRQLPDDPEIPRLLGQVYAALGYHRKAAAAYRLAVGQRDDDSRLYNDLGNVYVAQGEYGEAVSAYQAAIRLRPDDAEVHYNLGNAFVAQGEYGEAVSAYQAAIRLRPDDLDIWSNLGNAYGAQGNYTDAVEAYRSALQIDPNDAGTHYNLGRLYANREAYREAEEAYRIALRLSRANPDADSGFTADIYLNLGLVHRARGEYEQAISAYRSALELRPDDPRAYNNLGNVYSAREEYGKAVAVYQSALKLDPDDLKAHFNLGFIYGVRKEYAKAAAEYEKVVKIDPDDLQAHYRLAFAYSAQGEYGRAIAYYEEVVKKDPKFLQAYGNLGIAYLQKGDRRRAVAAFEKVLEIDPENGPAKEYLRRLKGR